MWKFRISRRAGVRTHRSLNRFAEGIGAGRCVTSVDDVVMSDVEGFVLRLCVISDRYRNRAVKELLAELDRRGIFVDRKVWAVRSIRRWRTRLPRGKAGCRALRDEGRRLSVGSSWM